MIAYIFILANLRFNFYGRVGKHWQHGALSVPPAHFAEIMSAVLGWSPR